MATPEDMPDPEEAPAEPSYRKITLDMTIPEIAEAFAECEPGEVLTVESKDDSTLVLAVGDEEPEEEEPAEEPEMPAPKSAVDRLKAKKRAAY